MDLEFAQNVLDVVSDGGVLYSESDCDRLQSQIASYQVEDFPFPRTQDREIRRISSFMWSPMSEMGHVALYALGAVRIEGAMHEPGV